MWKIKNTVDNEKLELKLLISKIIFSDVFSQIPAGSDPAAESSQERMTFPKLPLANPVHKIWTFLHVNCF